MEFTGVDSKPVLVTLRPKQVDVQDNMGTTLCSRTQVPSVLAYCITVHRSQGLTLPAVIMHVSKFFACGQLYTQSGLSRVRDFDKLPVTGVLSYSMKLCDKRVRDFKFELGTIWTRIANGPDHDDPGMSCWRASQNQTGAWSKWAHQWHTILPYLRGSWLPA